MFWITHEAIQDTHPKLRIHVTLWLCSLLISALQWLFWGGQHFAEIRPWLMLLYFVLLHGWGCGEYVAEFILTPLQSTGLVFKIQTLQKNTM